jgi:hypothetical protein
VYRQNEQQLLDVLEDVRNGSISQPSRDLLNQLSRDLPCDTLDKVRLFPHRVDAVQANNECLDLISGETFVFQSRDAGDKSALDRICSAPSTLSLKVKARVVLLKNLDKTLVNGMRGTVIGLSEGYPVIRFDNNRVHVVQPTQFIVEDGNRVLGTRTQVPLDLCYGMTIHKSQASSYDYVEVDLKHIFEEGQAYVALSRCKTLSGLRVLNFNERMIKPKESVKQFYNTLNSQEEIEQCFDFSPPKIRELTDLGEVNMAGTIPFKSPARESKIPIIQEECIAEQKELHITELHAALQWLKQHVVSDELKALFEVLRIYSCKEVKDLHPNLIKFIM